MKKPIENLMVQARIKNKIQIVLRNLLQSVALFFVALSVVILLERLFYPVLNIGLAAIFLGGMTGVFCVYSILQEKSTDRELALKIDKECCLQERISSVLCVPQDSPIKEALEQDAVQSMKKIDLSLVFPWRNQRLVLASAVCCFLCMALFSLPEQDVFGWGKKERERRHVLEKKKEMASQIRKKLEILEKKLPEKDLDPNLKVLLMDIKKLSEQLDQNSLKEKKEEIAQMNFLLEKIENFQEVKLGELSEIHPQMEKNFSATDFQETKELARALQEKNFAKVASELQKIQKEIKKLAEKKKLKKKLSKEEDERLKKLQAEMEKLAKAIEKNKELKKALEELAKKLEKMKTLDSLTAKQEKDLEKELKNLEALQEQLENLQALLEQMKNLEDMYQTLKDNRDKMLEAGTCPVCGKKKCLICDKSLCGHGEACKGHKPEDFLIQKGDGQSGLPIPGQGQGEGQGLGQGKGQGTKAPEGAAPENKWNTMQLQGNKFDGKTIAQFDFREVGPKGESKASYQEYASQMSQEATTGLSEKKIPQNYHEYVKKYFETVSKEKE